MKVQYSEPSCGAPKTAAVAEAKYNDLSTSIEKYASYLGMPEWRKMLNIKKKKIFFYPVNIV